MNEGRFEISGATLSGIEIFSGLDREEREAIARLCRGRRYRAEQQVVSRNDDGRDVYFIISGSVRVTIYSLSGKEIMFRDENAGRMFGLLSAIDGRPRSAHVVALTDTSLALIPPENYRQILRTYPGVAELTLRHLAGLVRSLSDRVEEFSVLGVNNRIHAELLRLARDHLRPDGSARISSAPTHAEIASRVSTHREAVTRELRALSRGGLIEKQGKALLVRDLDRLERMVREVLGDAST